MLSVRVVGRTLLFGGALLTVVGAAPTWVVVPLPAGDMTVSGLDAVSRIHPLFNGVVTALLSAVVVLLVLEDRPVALVAAAGVGLVVTAVAGAYVFAPRIVFGNDAVGRITATVATTGPGVTVTGVGGLSVVVGAVTALASELGESRPDQETNPDSEPDTGRESDRRTE